MENVKPHVGKTQMTQNVAENLRNEHTFEPVPSQTWGAVFYANAPVQQLIFLKIPAKMGLK